MSNSKPPLVESGSYQGDLTNVETLLTQEKPPREWTLWDAGDSFEVKKGPRPNPDYGEPDVKVIEYSAYEALRLDVQKLSNAVKMLTGESLSYQKQRDEARAEVARMDNQLKGMAVERDGAVLDMLKERDALRSENEFLRSRAETELSVGLGYRAEIRELKAENERYRHMVDEEAKHSNALKQQLAESEKCRQSYAKGIIKLGDERAEAIAALEWYARIEFVEMPIVISRGGVSLAARPQVERAKLAIEEHYRDKAKVTLAKLKGSV